MGLDSYASQIFPLFEEVRDGKGLKPRLSQQSAFYNALQVYSMPNWKDTLARKLEFIDSPIPGFCIDDLAPPSRNVGRGLPCLSLNRGPMPGPLPAECMRPFASLASLAVMIALTHLITTLFATHFGPL